MSKNKWYGFNPPFTGGYQKVMSRQADVRLIANDLQQLLMTSPGEREMRPEFGTILKQSLFETITYSLLEDIRSDIQNKIAQYEPRVSAQVEVTANADANMINVIVKAMYDGMNGLEPIDLELNLPVQTGGQ